MEREGVLVIGLVMLVALCALAAQVTRLRARAGRLEQGAVAQAHVLAARQSRLAALEQRQARALERLAAVEQAQTLVAVEVRKLRTVVPSAPVGESAGLVHSRLDAAGASADPSFEGDDDDGKTRTGAVHLTPTQLPLQTQEAPPSPSDDKDEPKRDTTKMPDPPVFVREPSNDDGEETTSIERAAQRLALHPPAPREPLAHLDLISTEDRAEEAAVRPLGPDDKTPRRPLAVVPVGRA